MKLWYIIYPTKFIVKDETQCKLFYLFCNVPPKYIPNLNKNMPSKKPKVSLKNFKLLKCLCFVNLCVLLFMLHKIVVVCTVWEITMETGT